MILYRYGLFYLHTDGRPSSELPIGTVYDVVYPEMNTPTGVQCDWCKVRFRVVMVEWRGNMQRMYAQVDERKLTPDEIEQYQYLLDSVGDEKVMAFE